MNYQVLVHQKFNDLSVYNLDMEKDLSQIKTSSAYKLNSMLIDEYTQFELFFRDMFLELGKVTKFQNKEKTEQIVQIECTYENACIYMEHPLFPRFIALRNTVEVAILKCTHEDLVTLTEKDTVTCKSFKDARSHFLK